MADERIKDFDERIKEALDRAPEVQGYSIRELPEITETPWPTTRWHLEAMRANCEQP